MKSRPIAEMEFERMLAKVPHVVCAPDTNQKTQAILRHARQKNAEKQAALVVSIGELNERIENVSESWRNFLRGIPWDVVVGPATS
tara:strand:+ start:44926 stop:45183 length:258 start_codon:yes stop_codon:yes gene_type:complete